MNFIDYDDMPNKDLEFWLKSIANEIQSDNKGFANVKALRLGAISTAMKRLDNLSVILTALQYIAWETSDRNAAYTAEKALTRIGIVSPDTIRSVRFENAK